MRALLCLLHTPYVCSMINQITVLACGKCSYAGEWSLDGGKHGQGGGVRHLLEKYTEVQPLVFGHYGEINKTFSTLIERLGRAIAARHHRPFGWKNANAGISRARAGVMRRISMAILRATAQHLLSGLDIIGSHSIYYASEKLPPPDERERGGARRVPRRCDGLRRLLRAEPRRQRVGTPWVRALEPAPVVR